MKKSLRGVFILLVVVVMLVILGFVSLEVANSYIESQLGVVIDENIAANNLKDTFSYSDIEVLAHKGLVVIKDIEFIDEVLVLELDSVSVQLPLDEAIALARNSMDATLTDVAIHISGIKGIDTSSNSIIEQDTLALAIKGKVNTSVFYGDYPIENADTNVKIEEVSMDLTGFRFTAPSVTMGIEAYSLDFSGDVRPSLFVTDVPNIYAPIVQALDKASFTLENFTLELDKETKGLVEFFVSLYVGELSFLGDAENWNIEKLAFAVEVTDTNVSITDVVCITNWLNMQAEASFAIEEPFDSFTSLEISLSMHEYNEELRPFFELIAQLMTGSKLPDGTFTCTIMLQDEHSFPVISFE